METDYQCYLLGCRSAGVEPLGLWRFRLLQQAYLHWVAEQEQQRVPTPPALERLAALVEAGYKIAAGSGREDPPGTAASGIREPRVPLNPQLIGSTARSLPSPNAPDVSFWRT